jgi:hypothetical protein
MKLILICILVIGSQFLTSCATKTAETTLPPVVVKPEPRIELSWETVGTKHWKDGKVRYGSVASSDIIVSEFRKDLDLYETAKDVTEICPKFHSLSDQLKIKALGEFWVGLAVWESNLKPESEAVDVGTPKYKDSWSVGYYQLSAKDKPNRETYKFTYEQLKETKPNILLSFEILRRQIKNTKTFMLDVSHPRIYWAIILKNGKYQKIPEIKARVLKYAPFCK